MRHAAWVIPPLVLAAVLGLSAVTKWGRGNSLHDIIRNLYLPAWVLPSWLAPAIPAVEVALALGLLAPWRPVFAVEIGYDQSAAVEALFRDTGAFNVQTVKDLADRDRVVTGVKNPLETGS